MLGYGQLDPYEQTYWKLIKIGNFSFIKMHLKLFVKKNGGPFVQGGEDINTYIMYLIITALAQYLSL